MSTTEGTSSAPTRQGHTFVSASLARHLVRGVIGFGSIGSAPLLAASVGPLGLLLVPAGFVALRGCPMCWVAGLLQTVSAGRLERSCDESGCALRRC
jgi:hypothetical protein